MVARGFDFVCPGWDLGYLTGAAGKELATARGGGDDGGWRGWVLGVEPYVRCGLCFTYLFVFLSVHPHRRARPDHQVLRRRG